MANTKGITSKTGNAPIVRQGHTENKRYGSNPNAKVRGGSAVRDLKIK